MGGEATRFGQYELLAHLADGGMAEIWLARQHGPANIEKLVVIKKLLERFARDREHVEMFLDEARINSRLSHANIAEVVELGEVDGRYFLAMEYVPGLSVAQLGKRCTERLGDVPQDIAAGLVAQACLGLHHAHERRQADGRPLNVIHRDVSPQNLLVTFQGNLKVVDFGIALAEGRQSRTVTGKVKGKTGYLSPEQCTGQPIDRRSDLFSLGIVFYELCTGRRLFKRPSLDRTYDAIVKDPVLPPSILNPRIDPPIEGVILKALDKDPKLRFQTALEMHDAIERALRELGMAAGPPELARFMEQHFARELAEQSKLREQAERGELHGTNPAMTNPISPLAVDVVESATASLKPRRPEAAPAPPSDEFPVISMSAEDAVATNPRVGTPLATATPPVTSPTVAMPPDGGSDRTLVEKMPLLHEDIGDEALLAKVFDDASTIDKKFSDTVPEGVPALDDDPRAPSPGPTESRPNSIDVVPDLRGETRLWPFIIGGVLLLATLGVIAWLLTR